MAAAMVALAAGLCAAACGHKGPPLAPLRPVPAAVSGWSAERAGMAVRLRFTIPGQNMDRSTPPAVDRVDIYALTRPADAPAPVAADLAVPANLVGTVVVRPLAPDQPGASADPRPAAGDAALFVDAVRTADAADAGALRYYAAVPAAGRRRGPVSPVLRVPLAGGPSAPTGVAVDYTEQTLVLTWDAAAGRQFVIDETDASGGGAKRLTDAPRDAARFEAPVAFGVARCFVVRAIVTERAVSVLGDPSAPVCVTPRDRFAPPAPTGLLAVAGDVGVDLVWTAVPAADLAGYHVWRGDGATGALARITAAPVTGTSYRDATARAGANYVYAITAVDTATPPNESQISARQVVAVRALRPDAGRER